MKFLIALLGLLVVFGLAYIASNGKKRFDIGRWSL